MTVGISANRFETMLIGKVFCSSREILSSALVQGAVEGSLVTGSF